jgi:hypothetical protein
MWVLKVIRSMMAATRRGSGNTAAPFADGRIARQADTCSFLPLGDDLKEQLGSAGVDLDVAELIKRQQALGVIWA